VSVERDRKVIGVMPHRIGLELRGGMMVGPGYSGGCRFDVYDIV
jgi:hypothetical protein